MEQVTFNAVGKYRRETLNGRSYLVVPMTSLVPGVLPGSKGPLYYPPDQVSRNVRAWDDQPLTMYHPTDRFGNPAPAKHDAHTIIKHRIGRVRNSVFDGKLKHEAWFNEAKTRNADKRWGTDVYDRIVNGRPIELSTGLQTTNVQAPPGYVNHRGERYEGLIAMNYVPDHIAVLPNQTGACSLRDGCGVGVVNSNPEGINQYTKGSGSSEDYVSPQDRVNRKIVEKLNNPTPKKLNAKQTAEKEKRDLHDKLAKMPRTEKDAIAREHGIDPDKYVSDYNLHSQLVNHPEARAKLMTRNEDLTEKRSFLSKLAGWLGVTNDQPRHPKDGRYQGHAHPAAKRGFEDTRVVESELDPMEDDDEIEEANNDEPTQNDSGKCKCGAVLENEADTCMNCMAGGKTVNSNPEGINQYTVGQKVRFEGKAADGSVEGGMDVHIIDPHSNKHEVDKVEGKGKKQRMYDKNGRTHLPTATVERPAQKFMGQIRPAKRFEAHHHTLFADHPMLTKNQTTNQEEATMALTAEAKKAHVDFLVTNCECWKGEHNRKVLNSLPDENLVKLRKQTEDATTNALVVNQLREAFDADLNLVTTNAIPDFIKKKMDAKKVEDEADDSEVEEVENDGKNDASFQSVKNSRKPTLAEWEASMPPEAQQTWNHAKTIVSEETARLTAALNAVAAKETNAQRKSLIVNRLKAKPPVSELRDLLTLVQPAPTVNAQPALNLFPSYLGAAGGFDAPTVNRDEAGDDVLNTLTMDDIVAEERARKSA